MIPWEGKEMINTQEERIKVFDAQIGHMIPEELRLWLIAKGFFTGANTTKEVVL